MKYRCTFTFTFPFQLLTTVLGIPYKLKTNKQTAESTKGLVKPETWNLNKWYVLLLLQESFIFSGPQKYTLENQRFSIRKSPNWKDNHLATLHFLVPSVFFGTKPTASWITFTPRKGNSNYQRLPPTKPWGSMYGTFAYIYHKNQPNVGKYTSPMDPQGKNSSFSPTWTNIFTWPSFSNCVSRISRFKSNFSWENRWNAPEENGTPGPKLTNVPPKKGLFNRKLHLNQPSIFSGHVRFPGSREKWPYMSGIFTCHLAI